MDTKSMKSKIFNFIFPTYSELILFLYSLIGLLFIVFHFNFLSKALILTLKQDTTREILLSFLTILIVIGIIALPIYRALSKRAWKRYEKRAILFVVILVDFIIGWNVYDALKTDSTPWEMIVPAFNSIHSTVIVIAYRYNLVNNTMISDEHAKIGDVIISGVIVIALFWFYHDILQKDPFITFSLCIFYATMINRGVFYLIKKLKK